MAIKKSELYSSLWKSCDELRGSMDASQYKDYVLVLLFVKYVSDKYAGQKDAIVVVPKGGGFADMVALKGDKEIGDKINKIIGKLAEANDLKGVIDQTDFNDPAKLGTGREMVERLSKLVAIFDKPELNFSGNRAEGDDLLGDAYEYLMRHFATESGKSKGQFYTPAEVSRIMAKVIGIRGAKTSTQTIYDPTCGSGSLLLKGHDEGKNATGADLTIYGQENDLATWSLARMNMFLHDCPSADIWKGNTLSSPHFTEKGSLKTFDFVVANPPFSDKAWGTGVNTEHDPYGRFAFGVPPTKNGDYAFLLHVLASMKSTGKGAIILPHGVLFRGNAEADIRRQIVRRGYIKGIIGLPFNLFYGTGIPACIVVLDKENAATRKGIFMIDASKGFLKDGNKNRLREMDLHKIVDVFNKQTDIPKYSRMVPLAEIEANDFNLNLTRYVDNSEPEDIQDIDAHLRGGIPNRDIEDLDPYWQVFPSLRDSLFKPYNRKSYSALKVQHADITRAIFAHTEFTSFQTSVARLFGKWKAAKTPALGEIKVGDKPKRLIQNLSEDLLETFHKARLVDPYDVYQHLMDYWAQTMQDDLYLLVKEGWKAVIDGQPNRDLIPATLLVNRYFAVDQAKIDQLKSDRDAITRQMEELEEEHGGDDGLLYDAKNDKGNLNKASVKTRLVEISSDSAAGDERKLLKSYLSLIEDEAEANRNVKDAAKVLDARVAAKYAKLAREDIKTLVVDDKWMHTLSSVVQSELDRVSKALTERIRQLNERYSTPLPKLIEGENAISARVDAHLAKMGALQHLLTGKCRLPGFTKDWQPTRLGDIGITFGGLTGKTKADFGTGNSSFLPFLNVITNTVIDVNFLESVRVSESERQNKVRKGDLFFNGSSETPEEVGMCAVLLNDLRSVYLNSFCFGFRFREGMEQNGLYLAYYFRSDQGRKLLFSLAQGAIRYNLSKASFLKLILPLPELKEQAAIAAVFSDIDAEISALEKRRTKTRAIKQGVMQELLKRENPHE